MFSWLIMEFPERCIYPSDSNDQITSLGVVEHGSVILTISRDGARILRGEDESCITYDIYLPGQVYIEPHRHMVIPSGVDIRLPKQLNFDVTTNHQSCLAVVIFDRPTIRNPGFTVVHHVIEPGYDGEMFVEVINYTDNPVCIKKSQPIAQFCFQLFIVPPIIINNS